MVNGFIVGLLRSAPVSGLSTILDRIRRGMKSNGPAETKTSTIFRYVALRKDEKLCPNCGDMMSYLSLGSIHTFFTCHQCGRRYSYDQAYDRYVGRLKEVGCNKKETRLGMLFTKPAAIDMQEMDSGRLKDTDSSLADREFAEHLTSGIDTGNVGLASFKHASYSKDSDIKEVSHV